uniref:Glycosyltransferase family 28 N-terminal domain-containing protein n=1 Tax=Mucochytrium quahogii TaxID=96639 RepID=A0A7S2SEB1_9STRA|mmetsp:Transcript_4652/g.10186  ORF Transcript_4652/g.10186 Transcript_4652/m.10186 type:complete len:875 (+) Transcript_4652:231-2855(+)
MMADRWWADLDDCDPISLEPLCELGYPPFELYSNSGSGVGGEGYVYYFDGQILAHYVVSTGSLINPMTRKPLQRKDCLRLDAYLAKHGLNVARVTDAFDLRKAVKGDKSGQRNAEMLRREATIVFHSLFNFERYSDRKRLNRKHKSKRKSKSKRQHATAPCVDTHELPFPPRPPTQALERLEASSSGLVHEERGLRVIDDDVWADFDFQAREFDQQFPALSQSKALPPGHQIRRGSRGTRGGRTHSGIQRPIAEINVENEPVESSEKSTDVEPKVVEVARDSTTSTHPEPAKPSVSTSTTLRQRRKKSSGERTKFFSAETVRRASMQDDSPKQLEKQKWLESEKQLLRVRELVLRAVLAVILLGLLYSSRLLSKASLSLQFIGSILTLFGVAKGVDSWKIPNPVRHHKAGPSWKERIRLNHQQKQVGVTLFALGTRGDVEPLLVLGRKLQEHSDIVVQICAPNVFEPLAKRFGIRFVSCGVQKFEPTKEWATSRSVAQFLNVASKQYVQNFHEVANGLFKACESAVARMHTDIIISSNFALLFALDIAESLNVPVWAFKFAPDTPTMEFPPFGETVWKLPLVTPLLNRLLYLRKSIFALRAMKEANLHSLQSKFRKETLDLLPPTMDDLAKLVSVPTIYGYSKHLIRKPKDWPVAHVVTGFCQCVSDDEVLLPHVEEFLLMDSKRPLVCITFGSMYSTLSPDDLGCIDLLCKQMLARNRRCIVVAVHPTKTLLKLSNSSKDVLIVDSIAYSKLFPRCACIVHHGGAGTTARVLFHGIPSVIVPILSWYDQAGWAHVVQQHGAGIHIPLSSFQVENVSRAVEQILDNPCYRHSAGGLGELLRQEDGASSASNMLLTDADIVEHFPVLKQKQKSRV